MLIAFVGSEASGKSTIIAEMGRRFGEAHTVVRIHAGKPPSTPLTLVPHLLLPALRQLFPEQRTTRVEARDADEAGSGKWSVPMLFAVRSVMLAYERRALLTRASRRAAQATIVLCDRFPSSRNGTPDGPQLGDLLTGSTENGLRRLLASIEARCYRDIDRPDLVIHLTAPLEVTLTRNATREKQEPEDYVRRRHSLTTALEFDDARVERIDTDRELEDTVRDVEATIRAEMSRRPEMG